VTGLALTTRVAAIIAEESSRPDRQDLQQEADNWNRTATSSFRDRGEAEQHRKERFLGSVELIELGMVCKRIRPIKLKRNACG
jgi:hypothetical protein